MRHFFAGLMACALMLCTGYALASRNSSGTMSAANGPYVSGTLITSTQINSRFADIENEITDSLSRSGKGGMTAPLKEADGTVTAPSFSFTSEPGTGWYRIGASDIGLSVLGTKKLDVTSAALLPAVPIQLSDGAVGTPAISFATETGTGFYRQSAGIPALAVGGAKVVSWNSGGQGIFGGLTIFVPGTTSTTNFSLLEASLTTGQSVAANFGASTSANASGTLTYTSNATANLSNACLGISGVASNILCVDGTSTTNVAGAAALNGGVSIGSGGTAISKSLRGTVVWNPGTISAGTIVTNAITITGAVAGADCIAGVTDPATLSGLEVQCIARTNTCSIAIVGPSGGTTLGSATFYCRVFNT